jgi:transcription elongation factor GreA
MEKERVVEKLASLFKEEAWGRMDPKDMGISRFRILDDFHRAQDNAETLAEVVRVCHEHLKERPDSITARYLLGLVAYESGTTDDRVFLKQLVDQFLGYHKWGLLNIWPR